MWTKLIEEINNTINQSLKNLLPVACPFNEFKYVHKLPHEGINPHRLKTSEDVLELEMVQVFGPTRGRNKYSFADVHDEKVLDKVKELYPIVYGKSIVPKSKLLGKEFTKSIMAKVVKKILVGKDVVEVKKELKVVDNIVKMEKVVKAKNELKQPASINKVGEISPWI